MSDTLYAIYHEYSISNSSGMVDHRCDLIGLCYDRDVAIEWIEKHNIKCIYASTPYGELISGSLILRFLGEIPFLTKENFKTENLWKRDPWAVENYLCHKAKDLDSRLCALPDSSIKCYDGMRKLQHLYPNITDEMIIDAVKDILKEKKIERINAVKDILKEKENN